MASNYTWSGPLTTQSKTRCECLHGTAVIDPVTDRCTCVSEIDGVRPTVTPTVKPLLRNGPEGVWAYLPYGATNIQKDPAKGNGIVAADGTIFGMRPLVLLALVAGGVWLLSQSDNKSTKGGAN